MTENYRGRPRFCIQVAVMAEGRDICYQAITSSINSISQFVFSLATVLAKLVCVLA